VPAGENPHLPGSHVCFARAAFHGSALIILFHFLHPVFFNVSALLCKNYFTRTVPKKQGAKASRDRFKAMNFFHSPIPGKRKQDLRQKQPTSKGAGIRPGKTECLQPVFCASTHAWLRPAGIHRDSAVVVLEITKKDP